MQSPAISALWRMLVTEACDAEEQRREVAATVERRRGSRPAFAVAEWLLAHRVPFTMTICKVIEKLREAQLAGNLPQAAYDAIDKISGEYETYKQQMRYHPLFYNRFLKPFELDRRVATPFSMHYAFDLNVTLENLTNSEPWLWLQNDARYHSSHPAPSTPELLETIKREYRRIDSLGVVQASGAAANRKRKQASGLGLAPKLLLEVEKQEQVLQRDWDDFKQRGENARNLWVKVNELLDASDVNQRVSQLQANAQGIASDGPVEENGLQFLTLMDTAISDAWLVVRAKWMQLAQLPAARPNGSPDAPGVVVFVNFAREMNYQLLNPFQPFQSTDDIIRLYMRDYYRHATAAIVLPFIDRSLDRLKEALDIVQLNPSAFQPRDQVNQLKEMITQAQTRLEQVQTDYKTVKAPNPLPVMINNSALYHMYKEIQRILISDNTGQSMQQLVVAHTATCPRDLHDRVMTAAIAAQEPVELHNQQVLRDMQLSLSSTKIAAGVSFVGTMRSVTAALAPVFTVWADQVYENLAKFNPGDCLASSTIEIPKDTVFRITEDTWEEYREALAGELKNYKGVNASRLMTTRRKDEDGPELQLILKLYFEVFKVTRN